MAGGKSHTHDFTDESGTLIGSVTAGRGQALTFTNLSTGATYSTRSNGAVQQVEYHSDFSTTLTTTGHNILIFFPTDVPAGPSTTLQVGRVVVDIDPNGVFTLRSVAGRSVDICAALS
jgi:hypothetical protein